MAWHRSNVKGNFVGYVIALAVLVGGMSLITLAEGDGLGWIQAWQVWVVVVIFAYLMSSPLTFETMSAGADWLQLRIVHPFRQTRHGHIKLYELIEIDVTQGPTEFYLRISDGDLASDRLLIEWQQDRRMWDLIYNGILHSVANGAHINRRAIQLLHIDKTPALEIARRSGRAGHPNAQPPDWQAPS